MELKKEKSTLKAMIHIYCKENHKHKSDLCSECDSLYTYAMSRLDHCPYKDDKPACSKCTTHCYKPDMRQTVRTVMKYSGPRMILHHPVLAVKHVIQSIK